MLYDTLKIFRECLETNSDVYQEMNVQGYIKTDSQGDVCLTSMMGHKKVSEFESSGVSKQNNMHVFKFHPTI